MIYVGSQNRDDRYRMSEMIRECPGLAPYTSERSKVIRNAHLSASLGHPVLSVEIYVWTGALVWIYGKYVNSIYSFIYLFLLSLWQQLENLS